MQASSGMEDGRSGGLNRFLNLFFKPYTLLVLFAVLIGAALRIWDYGSLPAGLNVDETSLTVEAASLHSFGIDRNGESYPVYFIAWGGGQSVLYSYLLAPLSPLGLTPEVIRLPMLIASLLTLGIVFGIARKLFSPSIALLALFLMAVSPWHVMMSRWALDANLFPFVFSLAFLFLVHADRNPLWFLAGMAGLAVSLYAYATAHFLVPLFLLLTVGFLWRRKILPVKILLAGIAVFTVLAWPIFLFIAINTLQLPEIHLGFLSIPRLISEPRFIEMTGFLSGAGIKYYFNNFLTVAKILFLNTDDLVYNSLPPYGWLFPGAVLLALVGTFLIAEKCKTQKKFGLWAFGAWLVLAFLLGIIQPPVVHRINILFIPLILSVAVAVDWIIRDEKILAAAAALGLGAYAVLFWREYTGLDYRSRIAWDFNDGLTSAIQSVQKYPALPVCITNDKYMPYVYVQLVDFRNPTENLATIHYENPVSKFRYVDKMGRYSFGIENCDLTMNTAYILKNDQRLPIDDSSFAIQDYGDYVVYVPKTAH